MSSIFERTGRYVLLLSIIFTSPLWALEHKLQFMEGDVTVRRGGRELVTEWGMVLLEGDVIETGRNSLAVIELIRGRVLKVTEETLLVLESTGADTSLELRRGGLFVKAGKLLSDTFVVRAEKVAAGIRGTEFFVAYGNTIDDAPDIWLCVNEGAVEVGVEGEDDSVMVNEGEGINILSGREISEPRAYAWTEDLNWNMDPSAGPVRDDTNLSGAYADLLDQDYF